MGQEPTAKILSIRSSDEDIVDQISDYLTRNNLNYSFHNGERVFIADLPGTSARYKLGIHIGGGDGIGCLNGIVYLPIKVPALRRAALLEALTRINFHILYGVFEFDIDDGELRVRATVTTGNGPATDQLLSFLIQTAYHSAERYLGPLMAIAFGDAHSSNVLAMASDSTQTIQ